MKTISIIIPCYQNEGSIPVLADRLISLAEKLAGRAQMKFVFVNDGSTDGTLSALLAFKNRFPSQVKIVNLSRNFGSYNAFLAGMSQSEGDCHVHLHADLQDPPELVEEMFTYFLGGNKLVIAYRQNREDASFFSSLYHLMVKKIAIKNIPPGGFDLMLFDEAIRKDIIAISEKNTNIVYLISWLGYPYIAIPYTRKRREHGTSQWKFWKKVRLFTDTFFSFSAYPLYILRLVCIIGIVLAMGIGVWLARSLFLGGGITDTWLILFGIMVLIVLLGISGIILAEYINRIHETVRKRPNYVIDEIK